MSKTYISKCGYVIRKDTLSSEDYKSIKTDLVAKPLVDSKYSVGDEHYNVYIETKNKLYIPKMYGIKKFGKPEKVLSNFSGKQWDHVIEFKGTPRDAQIESIDSLISACTSDPVLGGGGILHAGTGMGKSFMTLNILSKLKYKAIIVVNKIFLLKQWVSEIGVFMPSARVGIIQGAVCDVSDKDIVVAMLQSLTVKDYPKEKFEDFGVFVQDECHNVASKHFSKILFKLCSKYTIGLSATPNRSDGCENVFKLHIGDIVHRMSNNSRKALQMRIHCITLKGSGLYKEISSTRYNGEKQIQFTSMLTELVNIQQRNELIVSIVSQLMNETNNMRNILVLSDRREHVKNLHRMFCDSNVTFSTSIFLGAMKASDLEHAKEAQVIIGTASSIGEGVSIAKLDTLVLTTPKKFVAFGKKDGKKDSGKLEQIVGRILRKTQYEFNPLIVDLQDNFSIFKNQNRQRNIFYNKHFQNKIMTSQTIDLNDNGSFELVFSENTEYDSDIDDDNDVAQTTENDNSYLIDEQ